MATDYAGAVRAGTLAAARAHAELGTREIVERLGGNVDVFGVISGLDAVPADVEELLAQPAASYSPAQRVGTR